MWIQGEIAITTTAQHQQDPERDMQPDPAEGSRPEGRLSGIFKRQ